VNAAMRAKPLGDLRAIERRRRARGDIVRDTAVIGGSIRSVRHSRKLGERIAAIRADARSFTLALLSWPHRPP
jgi:hypothetical protein